MAKQVSTLKVTGKLGDIVGSKGANGDVIARAYQPEVKNPNTKKQVSARTKFLTATGLAGGIKIFPGFVKYGKQLGITARNAFVKTLMKGDSISVTESGDQFDSTIDFGAVQVSRGVTTAPAFNAPSFAEANEVSVGWTSESGRFANNDTVIILVYSADLNEAVYGQASYGAGSCSVEVPVRWSGMSVHVYGYALCETEAGQGVEYRSYWTNSNVEASAEMRTLEGMMTPSASAYIGHGDIA